MIIHHGWPGLEHRPFSDEEIKEVREGEAVRPEAFWASFVTSSDLHPDTYLILFVIVSYISSGHINIYIWYNLLTFYLPICLIIFAWFMPAIYRNGNLWILDLSILLTNITLRGSQPFSDVRCNGLKQPTSRDFLRYPTWWFLLYHFISISSTRCGYFWEYIINILPGMASLKIFFYITIPKWSSRCQCWVAPGFCHLWSRQQPFRGRSRVGEPMVLAVARATGTSLRKKNHWNNGIQDDSNIISWGFAQNGLQVTKPQ